MQGGGFHISKALSNVATKYSNAEMIADKVFKSTKVSNESDLYNIYKRDFRLPDSGRGNGASANQETWGVTQGSYACQEQALAAVITDRDVQNTDSGIQLQADTVEFLTDKLMMTKEKLLSDLIFTTTSAGNNVTLNTATSWAYNTTTSAPINIVNSASSVVLDSSGVSPNTLVIGSLVYLRLRNNPNLYNRIQYVEKAIITEDLMASLLDVDNVYTGKAIYDSANESHPAAVESITAIWGNAAWLGYINPSSGRKALTAGLTLESKPFQVKSWREEAKAGNVYEVSQNYCHKMVATAAAFYFVTPALV